MQVECGTAAGKLVCCGLIALYGAECRLEMAVADIATAKIVSHKRGAVTASKPVGKGGSQKRIFDIDIARRAIHHKSSSTCFSGACRENTIVNAVLYGQIVVVVVVVVSNAGHSACAICVSDIH